LYYVQIDNTALTTKIVAYSLSDGQKKVIDQTKNDQRYYVDLLTNGHNLLYLVANNKDASFTFENKDYELLRSVIEELPSKEVALLELYYFQGFTVKEIARIMSYSVSKVKIQLMRCRAKLRKKLEKKGYLNGNI